MVNCFALKRSAHKSAEVMCDAHCVKMLLESTQLLYAIWDGFEHPAFKLQAYRTTHRHHPITLWAGSCAAAYNWLLAHGEALCKEYTERYGKEHKCEQHIKQLQLAGVPPHVPANDNGEWVERLKNAVLATEDTPEGCSRFPLCMGDHVDECIVRNKSGNISATKSMAKYYKLKAVLFKKPFRYKKGEYSFSLLK